MKKEVNVKQEVKKKDSIYSFIKLPDFFTLGNAVLGLTSIFFAIRGNITGASIAILCAAVFDYLDGAVARAINRTGNFGKEMDSLADVISFVLAPVILGYTVLSTSFIEIFSLIFFLCAGILRLARFNVTQKKHFFEGLPTTASGIITSVLVLILSPENIRILVPINILLAILMISAIKVKKL